METAQRDSLRRHYGRVGLALFLYFALTLLLQTALHLAINYAAPELTEKSWYALALSFVPMYAVGFPVFCALLPRAPARELLPEKRKLPLSFFVLLLMCFGCLYPGNLIGQGADALVSRLLRAPAMGNPVEAVADRSGLTAYFLFAVLLAPVLEELTFRKLLLDRLRLIDKPSALIFSSLAFALFHGNLVQVFYAFGAGLVLGAVYLRCGKVRVTMLLHVLINFLGGFVTVVLLRFVDVDNLMATPLPTLLLSVYSLAMVAAAVAGVVFLIRERGLFRVGDAGDRLGPGDRFCLPFLRPGFILYFFAALAVMFLAYY